MSDTRNPATDPSGQQPEVIDINDLPASSPTLNQDAASQVRGGVGSIDPVTKKSVKWEGPDFDAVK